MNRRIIKSILQRKFNDYLQSITNENLKNLIKNNTIITGGAIASMLIKEKVNDFDLYFTNQEITTKVAQYYVDWFIRLHGNNKSLLTRNPEVRVEENGRVRIRIKSAGFIGENTDESQYQYFEGRPIEEGEEYIRQSIEENLEDADYLDGTKIDNNGKKEKYRPVFLTDNAITLSNKIQIIIRFYGNPDEIHDNYDFVHCTNYWESKDNNLELRPAALESLLAKELRYTGSRYPICSFIRTRKFLKKGWHINAGQMLKICSQISELDLSNIDVLDDQLTGVDTAYFIQLINMLKEKQTKEPDFHIDMPYVCSLIDKIFN